MKETFSESVFWAIIQGAIFFGVGYLVWGLVDPKSTDVSYMAFLGICWSFGALIGRRLR